MMITDKWLTDNKTKAGGYTKSQLALIGVKWPPVSGWKKSVINTEISEEIKTTFEQISQQTKL